MIQCTKDLVEVGVGVEVKVEIKILRREVEAVTPRSARKSAGKTRRSARRARNRT